MNASQKPKDGSNQQKKLTKQSKSESKKKGDIPQETLDKMNESVRGIKTRLGVSVTGISPHAIHRGDERSVDIDKIKLTLEDADATYPGNVKGRTCYQKGKYRIVLADNGNIVTAIDLEEED